MSYYLNKIPNFINKHDYFYIKNKFEEILDEYPDKFVINIYYLEDYLCKIIVRRIDSNSGWGKNLKILLHGLDNSDEIISIGSSYHENKIIEIYTNVKLYKNDDNNDSKVFDKNIIQCDKNNIIDNNIKFLNFTNIIDNNININYVFFNIYEQREFIKDNSKKYLNLFDLIKDDEIKNIIFICNYLYINGGYYISLNIDLYKSIKNLNKNNTNYYSLDENNFINLFLTEKENNDILEYLNFILNKLGYNNKTIKKLNNNTKNINSDATDKENSSLQGDMLDLPKVKGATKEQTMIDINFIFKNSEKISEEEFNKNINTYKFIKNNIFYKNIFKINNYKFIINSDNTNYNIEYLNLDYFLIKELDDSKFIENNLELICINNDIDIYNTIIFNENINIVIFNVAGEKFIKKI